MSNKDPNVDHSLISRREAIRRVSLMLGGVALAGGTALLTTTRAGGTTLFAESEVALLDEIADTILPDTDTPGAKAAGVGPFIALMVTDAYDPEEQKTFQQGMKSLQQACHAEYGDTFLNVTPQQRLTLLQRLDRENAEHDQSDADGVHYFGMMKQLTLLGYFTSEIGYTQAMRYQETPGRYDPCIPYQPGDKAWARHA